MKQIIITAVAFFSLVACGKKDNLTAPVGRDLSKTLSENGKKQQEHLYDDNCYVFKYDVEFALNSGYRYRYYNTMYYTTQYNTTPREVSDFAMFRQNVAKTVKGQLVIPASDGPITKLWINTSRQFNVLGDWWALNCRTTTTLYDGTSPFPTTVTDWGCLSLGGTITQRLFQYSIEKCSS